MKEKENKEQEKKKKGIEDRKGGRGRERGVRKDKLEE